jgi:hypothetical protein
MPAKQLPEQHTSTVEQAETPEGTGTRMQPRPDESRSGSSTCGLATPVFDAGIDQSHVRMLRTESIHGAGQAPDPSVLEDTVSKLVESAIAAARLDEEEHQRGKLNEKLETAVCQLVTCAIAEAQSLLAKVTRKEMGEYKDARLSAAPGARSTVDLARAQTRVGSRQRCRHSDSAVKAEKVSLETCKQEETDEQEEETDKVKGTCCSLEARLHGNEEHLEAAARQVVTRAIHQAQMHLVEEEQKRFDAALDELVAALISEARLLCQDQKEKQGQYLEESVFKNEAMTGGGGELADSILSADATCSAGAYPADDSFMVDAAAEAHLSSLELSTCSIPELPSSSTCSIPHLPCSFLALDDVSNTPQNRKHSPLQPPLLDMPPTADKDAQQSSSCALLELTAAVAEFNSQLAQVAVPASSSTHARTHERTHADFRNV